MSALTQDLEERGLLDDIAVVCGAVRPHATINANAGRDHWPTSPAHSAAGACGSAGWLDDALGRAAQSRRPFREGLLRRCISGSIDVARRNHRLPGAILVGEHGHLAELVE